MSPLRFRFFLILGGLLILGSAGIAAESAYRAKIRRDLASLEAAVLAVHPGFRLTNRSLLRFGKNADSMEPSLLEDLAQGIRRRLGLRSRLDFEGDPDDPWMHAYHVVSVTLEREKNYQRSDHIFIWSPRELRFVHYYDWCRGSAEGRCPWRHDPVRFSKKPCTVHCNCP